ncbi:hypothetical protein IQ07DRAFT_57939 [Pyrenochaeta sp. DS3sAY3a]|nr:hypothetical protein IQ07DRAFT_57939 [Pyrenochaeta sp. DS3sAY3a]
MLFFYASMRRRPIELSTYWERSAYEYATTLFDEYDLTKISNPAKSLQNNKRRKRRSGRSRISISDENIDDQNYLHHQQLLIPLLTRLHTLLPPELRDIIYTHIIGHASQIYTFQPPNLLFRLDTEMPVAPISIIPPSLLKMEHSSANHTHPSPDQATLAALAALTVSELTSHVLRSKTWFLRYRYNGELLEFVRNPGVYVVGATDRHHPQTQVQTQTHHPPNNKATLQHHRHPSHTSKSSSRLPPPQKTTPTTTKTSSTHGRHYSPPPATLDAPSYARSYTATCAR